MGVPGNGVGLGVWWFMECGVLVCGELGSVGMWGSAVADPGRGRGAMPPPGPVKISLKKDGHQRRPHRFHVSRHTHPSHPVTGSATSSTGVGARRYGCSFTAFCLDIPDSVSGVLLEFWLPLDRPVVKIGCFITHAIQSKLKDHSYDIPQWLCIIFISNIFVDPYVKVLLEAMKAHGW